MSSRPTKHQWFIWVTFLVALILDVLPLPNWAIWLRPHWTFLVLIYWMMMAPDTIGFLTAFSVGLVIDLLSGTLLGAHAFAMIIVALPVMKFYQRIRLFPLLQQALIIAGFVFLYQLLIFICQGIVGLLPHSIFYWLPVITSAILWPWVFILLRDCQARIED